MMRRCSRLQTARSRSGKAERRGIEVHDGGMGTSEEAVPSREKGIVLTSSLGRLILLGKDVRVVCVIHKVVMSLVGD